MSCRPYLRRMSILLLSMTLVVVAACQAQPTTAPAGPTPLPPTATPVPPAPPEEETITISLDGEAVTLDPHAAVSRAFNVIDHNIYEPLVGLERDTFNFEPVLAESWEISPDELTYTFHLRKGVKFQDGTPFNAEAVKFSFERLMTLKKGSYWVLKALEEIEIIDDYTVRITIGPGGPPFMKGLIMVFMVSPTAVQEHEQGGDMGEDWLSSNTAGTGPYRLVEWIRGDRIVLEKFPDYWQGWDRAHFSRAVLLVVPEAGTQQMMLEEGDVDLAEKIPIESIAGLAEDPDITVYRAPGVRVLYIRFHCSGGPTADVTVRKALSYAFDLEAFDQATEGYFSEPEGPVPSNFVDGWKPELPYSFDLEKSRELFEEAGIGPGSTIDAYFTATQVEQQRAAEILHARLAEIDINLNVIEMEWAPLSTSLVEWGETEDPANAKPMYFKYTTPRIPDAYSYLWYMWHSDAAYGGGDNHMYYLNPVVDELIDKGTLAADEQEKLDYYRQAVEAIVEDYTDIYLGAKDRVYTVRSDIKGFYINPSYYPAWHLYPLYREE